MASVEAVTDASGHSRKSVVTEATVERGGGHYAPYELYVFCNGSWEHQTVSTTAISNNLCSDKLQTIVFTFEWHVLLTLPILDDEQQHNFTIDVHPS